MFVFPVLRGGGNECVRLRRRGCGRCVEKLSGRGGGGWGLRRFGSRVVWVCEVEGRGEGGDSREEDELSAGLRIETAAVTSYLPPKEGVDEETRRRMVLQRLKLEEEEMLQAQRAKEEKAQREREEDERRAEERIKAPLPKRRMFVAVDLPQNARARITELRRKARRDWEEGEIEYLLERERKTGCELQREERGTRLVSWLRIPENEEWRLTMNYVGWTTDDAVPFLREAIEKALRKVPQFDVFVSKNMTSHPAANPLRTRNFHVRVGAADGSIMLNNLALVIKDYIDEFKAKPDTYKKFGLRLKPPPILKGDRDERKRQRKRLQKIKPEYQDGFSSTITLGYIDYYASTAERLRCYNSIAPERHVLIEQDQIFTLKEVVLYEQVIDGRNVIYRPLAVVPLREAPPPEVKRIDGLPQDAPLEMDTQISSPDFVASTIDDLSILRRLEEIEEDEPKEFKNLIHDTDDDDQLVEALDVYEKDREPESAFDE
mmetsp:Transcript_18286/g.38195  ORF Transcript_18286/g.38195 Transcript_18286/m.38195 type:complete len:489 (-) Transcript_18286:3158-4624(-)